MRGVIILPWPPSSLSGHAKGHWRGKASVTAKHRAWAFAATKAAGAISLPVSGDIRVNFGFVPPDLRGDRTNFPNRLKPYIDGIAEALGVNDSRFLPSYAFAAPEKGAARVVVTVMPDEARAIGDIVRPIVARVMEGKSE